VLRHFLALAGCLLGVPPGEDDVCALEPFLGNEQELGANSLVSGMLRHFKAFRSGETVFLFLLFGHWRLPRRLLLQCRLANNSKAIQLFLKKIRPAKALPLRNNSIFAPLRQTKTPARGAPAHSLG
jgi:hypothetical protein